MSAAADGETVAYVCASRGRHELLAPLQAAGADMHSVGSRGHHETPLCAACRSGHAETVRELLRLGVQATAESSECRPLHLAARRGHVEVARVLVAARASPDSRDQAGETPLHKAAQFGHKAAVAFLLASGADPSLRDSAGRTPLDASRAAAGTVAAEAAHHGGACGECAELLELRLHQHDKGSGRIATQSL